MPSRMVEIWVGLFILGGFAALFILAMRVSNLAVWDSEGSTYEVYASFENIGGLKVRSPVAIAGVRIGRVAAIDYDSQTYEAVVTLRIDAKYSQLPLDTSASILTAGLLGEQYVGLGPGGDSENLKNGSHIRVTQSAVVLEQLISQLLFNKAEGGDQ